MKRNQESTVVLPEDFCRAMEALAARKGLSLNELARRALDAYLWQEEQRELFDSFTRLGECPAECDVGYAWGAQSEALELVDPVD